MKTGICLLLTVIGFSPAFSVAAIAEKSRELNEVQAKIQQVGSDLKNLSAEKSAVIERLKLLEKQYSDLSNSLNSIKTEVKQQEENLQTLRNKISAAQKDIQIQRHGLEGLIKSAYAIGDRQGLKLILNQHDPSLTSRMLMYRNYIGKARLQKMLAINEDYNSLQQMEAQKNTEAQLLQRALEKKQQESNAIQILKSQRENLLAQLEGDYQSKNTQMARLVQDKKKLENLVASLQKTDDNASTEHAPVAEIAHIRQKQPKLEQESPEKPKKTDKETLSNTIFAEMQGQLPWPVKGAITERFGSRRFETTWDGIVISAREGADIHAVASGRVVYADWLRGYGLMLIVDHGNGYMSLYAFNQSLQKNVGEQVRSGETLASVGRSGGRSQAALYFGIRKKGRPVDPEQWFRKTARN